MKNEPMLPNIAVVIPAYKVREHIIDVIDQIGPEVCKIYVVDDCCPDGSGDFVTSNLNQVRLKVIKNKQNMGVGGAVMAGYKAAISDGADIIVKIDGDGQMNPKLINSFVMPIVRGEADYTKGNRFYNLSNLKLMPPLRVFGNAGLSFVSKFSTGYWNLFDPTNGYTAIEAKVAACLDFDKISQRYFFETDILFRLNILRAVVVDVPMEAVYGNEVSNLKIRKIFGEFLVKNIKNAFKRIFYNYYLRDMSPASFELPIGAGMLAFGIVYGLSHWVQSVQTSLPSPAGTVMLAALPIILGCQLLLGFLSFDIGSVPTSVFHKKLEQRTRDAI